MHINSTYIRILNIQNTIYFIVESNVRVPLSKTSRNSSDFIIADLYTLKSVELAKKIFLGCITKLNLLLIHALIRRGKLSINRQLVGMTVN